MKKADLKKLRGILLAPLSNSRGYALVVGAVILILTAGSIGFYLSGLTVRDSEASAGSLNHLRAHYLAQSGLEWSIEQLMTYNPQDTIFSFAEGNIELTSTSTADTAFTLYSRGKVGDYEKVLNLDVKVRSNRFFPDTSLIALPDTREVPPDTLIIQDPYVAATYIEQNQSGSLGNRPYFHVGYQNAGSGESRTLVQFDLDVIPAGASIDTAILIVHKMPSHEQRVHQVAVHEITSFWKRAQVTWTNAYNGVPWTAGGAYNATGLDTTIMTSGGPQYWNVTSTVRNAVQQGDPYYGWLLRDINPTVRTFSRFSRPIPPKLYVIYRRTGNYLLIGEEPQINGDLFAGMDIYVIDSTRLGQAPGLSTTLIVPDTAHVFRYADTAKTSISMRPKIYFPEMTNIVNSLDSTANAITNYSGNKFLSWSPSPTLDLSLYENNTVFVKNYILFNSVNVLDMPKSEPGFIVTAGYVNANFSHFGDNVVVIATGNITLSNTTAGSNFLPPNPNIVNMFWSTNGDININSGSTLYCNLVAYNGNGNLASMLYGGLFTGHTARLTSTSAYLEGALWTNYYLYNFIDRGRLNLTGQVPEVFAGSNRTVYITSSIRDQ